MSEGIDIKMINRYRTLPRIVVLMFVLTAMTWAQGNLTQVNFYLLWDATPEQIIPSTDAAGICYSPDFDGMIISDSEINEDQYWSTSNSNMFAVSYAGDELYSNWASAETAVADKEPTGVCYNSSDGYYYTSNDENNRIYQYVYNSSTDKLEFTDTKWDIDGDYLSIGDDLEGITVNSANSHFFIANGEYKNHPSIIEAIITGSTLSIVGYWPTDAGAHQITDPEGIAFHDGTGHIFIISSPDMAIFEFATDGTYIQEYDISTLFPAPIAPQGIGFGPSSPPYAGESLYIADGGYDKTDSPSSDWPDGMIYEIRFPDMSLPVELMNFAAEDFDGRVRLNWATASEIENAWWIIEKSWGDDDEFYEIKRLEGAGTTPSGAQYEFIDDNVLAGETYRYRIIDMDYSGVRTVNKTVSVTLELPKQFIVQQNYPNPFNNQTTMVFELPHSARVQLEIFDIRGRLIESRDAGTFSAGQSNLRWDASRVAAGMYFYRLTAVFADGSRMRAVRKMILRQ